MQTQRPEKWNSLSVDFMTMAAGPSAALTWRRSTQLDSHHAGLHLSCFKLVRSCTLAAFDGSRPVFLFFAAVCSPPAWAALPPTQLVHRSVASYPDCILHLQLPEYLFFFNPPLMLSAAMKSSSMLNEPHGWFLNLILRVSALTKSGLLMGFMRPRLECCPKARSFKFSFDCPSHLHAIKPHVYDGVICSHLPHGQQKWYVKCPKQTGLN